MKSKILSIEDFINDPDFKLNLNIQKAESYIKEDSIEKGHIYDAVRWGKLGEQEFPKTGKQVKEMLAIAKSDLLSKKTMLEAEQSAIGKIINVDCDDFYERNGKKYGRYSWTLIDSFSPVDAMGNKTYSSGDPNSQYVLCEKYNQYNHRFAEIDEDLLAIDVLEDVFEDDKKYQIQLKTLIELMKKEQ